MFMYILRGPSISGQVWLGYGQFLVDPHPLGPMESTHANCVVWGAKGQLPPPLTLEMAYSDSLPKPVSASLGTEKASCTKHVSQPDS